MIIPSPLLGSNSILLENKRKGVLFCCYATCCHVELWSNLTKEKQWTSFPMTKTDNSQHFKVNVDTFHLLPGEYEFTYRWKRGPNEPWVWYGEPGQNGRIRIVSRSTPRSVDASISQLCFVQKEHVGQVQLCHFKTQSKNPSYSLGSVKPSIHSYVAFLRKGSSWLTSLGGASNFDNHSTHEKWQLLLYQDNVRGDTHLWMAVGQHVDCWLSPGNKCTINLNKVAHQDEDAHLLICSSPKKHNVAQLFEVALGYYRKSIRKEELSTAQLLKTDADALDYLGYCTWNAFGKTVTEDNLYQAMDSLTAHNIQVSYMIIDDGWSEVCNDQLVSMDTDKSKFPHKLKGTIANLKSKYPFLKRVGVWHALWGYWNGVHSHLGDHYGGFTTKEDKGNEIGLLSSPEKFYHDFYKYLQHAGVDFVKVDNQGSFLDLIQPESGKVYGLWNRYRKAMIESADKFLDGQVRHCMSLTPHILFEEIWSTKTKSTFRNSDDYFPHESDSHTWHIYTNALNALLLAQYPVISDWDMFESDHPFAEYHASSRAISGGPVFITDTPSKHNTELIQRLVAQTKSGKYTLLRSKQLALPTFETVFGNVMQHGDLVSLYNTHREQFKEEHLYGICGFWNTGAEDRLGVVSSNLCLSPSVAYVVSGLDKGRCVLLEPYNNTVKDRSSDAMSVRVAGLSSSLVSLSHVSTMGPLSVACLGLVDKFNGTRCILNTTLTEAKDTFAVYEAILSHRSRQCGFWVHSSTQIKKPFVTRITIDDLQLESRKDWTYNTETGFLCVNMTAVELINSKRNDFRIQIHLMR